MSYCDGCAMTRDLRQEIERLREALTEQAGVKQTVYNAAVRKLESQHREIERLRAALDHADQWFMQMANQGTLDATVGLRKHIAAALAPAREPTT